ncbi:MAG: hypothetical protein P4L50_19560 [Anaerolineaceae bacterium]|nr:hypothetical protein [Anaerolineaceae bacterium]
MNRKPSGLTMQLSKPVGVLSYKEAEGLPFTLWIRIKKWAEHEGEIEVGNIDAQNIIQYLNWLRTDCIPHRYGGKTHPLSPKTIRNF